MRKVKEAPKVFISDPQKVRYIVQKTMNRISEIVGATLGPIGRNILLESKHHGIGNKNTKDGVSVFESLGSRDIFESLIIEQARDAAKRTASEAGDGTTSSTILSAALIDRLFEFTDKNKKYSPQKAAREMTKIVRTVLIPKIQELSIKIDESNIHLLKNVATVSANGDEDMAEAVIKAFELIGYGESSHVTIKEIAGPYGYSVSSIEGFPVPIGYEESAGRNHMSFINDQGNQRCVLEKPLFLIFDGKISDMSMIYDFLVRVSEEYIAGNTNYKNIVLVAHAFGDSVLNTLATNFVNPDTINVVPMTTPMAPFSHSQLQFLMDLSAFTGAKIFGLKAPISGATASDLGSGMNQFEMYRFRSTIVGDPDDMNIEVRAEDLKKQSEQAASQAEKLWITERLGKLTNGIAKIEVSAGSGGELKELADRVEDAVMAVRSAVSKGVLPGGGRVLMDLAIELSKDRDAGLVAHQILAPALMVPITRLLQSSHSNEDIEEIVEHLINNPDEVYNILELGFEKIENTGIFDSAPAVSEALLNAASIASVLGTLGGMVAYERDDVFERSEAAADLEYQRMVDNPEAFTNEADLRA